RTSLPPLQRSSPSIAPARRRAWRADARSPWRSPIATTRSAAGKRNGRVDVGASPVDEPLDSGPDVAKALDEVGRASGAAASWASINAGFWASRAGAGDALVEPSRVAPDVESWFCGSGILRLHATKDKLSKMAARNMG